MQTRLDSALQDVTGKFHMLEETEKDMVRKALMEERSHFCLFISHCKPVVVSVCVCVCVELKVICQNIIIMLLIAKGNYRF